MKITRSINDDNMGLVSFIVKSTQNKLILIITTMYDAESWLSKC